MGLGKTVAAVAVAEELLGQGKISTGLCVVPAGIKYQWGAQIAKLTDVDAKQILVKDDEGNKQTLVVPTDEFCVILGDGGPDARKEQYRQIYATQPDYVIMGYENVLNDWPQVRRIKPGLIVADECLIAGTMVNTVNGLVPIELIKVGDYILNATGIDEVEDTSVSCKDQVIKILLDDGRHITCSDNHIFFTNYGKVPASRLSKGVYLYGQSECLRIMQESSFINNNSNCKRKGSDKTKQEKILRYSLFSEMENETTGNTRKGIYERTIPENFCKGALLEDEQPRFNYAKRSTNSATSADVNNKWYKRKSKFDSKKDRTQTSNSRRKWSWNDSSPTVITRAFRGALGGRVYSSNGKRINNRWLSFSLQTRLGVPKIFIGSRGRRFIPWTFNSTRTGSKENFMAGGAWVVRVEVHKYGSSEFAKLSGGKDTITLYDLKIKNHPSFTVNGILVHNCTAIKTFRAKRTKQIKRLEAEWRIGLTGTAVENGKPEEVFSIMQWVADEVFGPYDFYDKSYIVRNNYGGVQYYRNLDVLHKKLSVAMSRKTREDPEVKPFLPEMDEKNIDVVITPKLRKAYKVIGRDLLKTLYEAQKLGASGKFDVHVHYAGGVGNDDHPLKGQIAARMMALSMLLDHPDLIRKSAQEWNESERQRKAGATKKNWPGSAYCAELVKNGVIDGLRDAPKLDQTIETVTDILASNPKNKVIIFSFHPFMLELLQKGLSGSSVLYHGGMSDGGKAAAVQQFTNDPDTRVFLSSHAGAYGVDLHMANYLINFDQAQSSGKQDQINHRHDRVASKFENIYVINMLTKATTEVRDFARNHQKRRVASAILDGVGSDDGEIHNEVESLTECLERTTR